MALLTRSQQRGLLIVAVLVALFWVVRHWALL